jgi:alpha-1,2-mannosyltransferase
MSLSAPATTPPADDIYKKMAVAATVFAVIFEAGYLATSAPPYDRFGYLIGRDFVSTWMGAHSALAGGPAAWFDFDTYNAALAARFNPAFPHHSWSYPPHLLLLIWPLAFLPYLPAYLVWCALGMALYVLAASEGGRRRERLFMLAVAPAAWLNIFTGQNGFLTSALMIGGLAQLGRRPILSGICFGLLTIKPQLGLLLPVMLVLTGQWRAILAAIATVVVLVVATGLMFGFEIWPEYFRLVPPVLSAILAEGQGLFTIMMPTVFMNARIAHLPLDVAWALQIATSLAAVAAVVWTYWRRRDPVLSVALFVTATFLVTPYAFNYDMVVFGWVIALLRERGGEPLDDRLAMAVWTLPVTAMLLGLFGIPGSAAVLAAFAARLLWRLKTGEAACTVPSGLRAAVAADPPADPGAMPGPIPAA